MSRLQGLIAELCPDGVEYRALGDVGTFSRGSSFQKKDFVTEGTPCIHYGQIHTRFTISTDTVVSYLDETFAAKMKRAKSGDLIIATTSEDDDAVGKAIAWLGETDVVISNDAYIYRHSLDPKYMAYIFASDLFQEPKRQYITGTKVRRLNDKSMSKIVIPVPPIEVQREVVRILDEYTAAHAELVRQLEHEMALREQQLSIARNQLLTFTERERVRWATLGEICRVGRGTYITGKEVMPGTIPVILGGMEPAYYHNVSNHEGEAIVVSRSGVNAGYASFWDEPIFVSDGFVVDNPAKNVSLQYVFEVMKSLQQEMIGMNRGSGVPHITGKMLSSISIPVPSVEIQSKLVDILQDASKHFDELCAELEVEIAARSVEAAHIRNQLLSFPEKAA